MLKDIQLKNFRSIEKLEISDFRRINLFVGPNNCGKTTILEALFQIVGMSNPRLPININAFRELVHTESNDFRYNFRDLDYSNTIYLSCTDDLEGTRSVTIIPKVLDQTTQRTDDDRKHGVAASADTTSEQSVLGLCFEYETSAQKGKKFSSEIVIHPSSVETQQDQNYKETMVGRFLNSHTLYRNLPERIDVIQRNKKKQKLIEAVSRIETNVVDIALATNDLIYVDIGIQQMIPMNLMGDGFRRACAVIANLLSMEQGVLIIDEIENGLHFQTQKILWDAIISTAMEYNVQVFLSTHSYECIRTLSKVLEEENYDASALRLYSIQKLVRGRHAAYAYDSEELSAVIGSDVEIRGTLIK